MLKKWSNFSNKKKFTMHQKELKWLVCLTTTNWIISWLFSTENSIVDTKFATSKETHIIIINLILPGWWLNLWMATDSILAKVYAYVGLYKQSDGSLLDINTGRNTDSSHIVDGPTGTGCVSYRVILKDYVIDDCTNTIPAICVA